MDGQERFVAEQNVRRYIDHMVQEPEALKRLVLARLLVAEENKFARDVGRFEAVQRWISRCDAHIDRHNGLLKAASEADGTRMKRAIRLMEQIRTTLVAFQTTWELDMKDAEKFLDGS